MGRRDDDPNGGKRSRRKGVAEAGRRGREQQQQRGGCGNCGAGESQSHGLFLLDVPKYNYESSLKCRAGEESGVMPIFDCFNSCRRSLCPFVLRRSEIFGLGGWRLSRDLSFPNPIHQFLYSHWADWAPHGVLFVTLSFLR